MKEKDMSTVQGEPLDDQDLETATGGGNYGYYGYRGSQKKRCPRCGTYYFEGKSCTCALQRSLGLGQSPDGMGERTPLPNQSLNDLITRPLPESLS